MSVNVNGGQVQFSAVINTDDFDSGLTKLGNGLASAAKTAVAVATAATVAVTAAVGGIVSGSIKEFSRFEQMAGGIEALMGNAAEQVKTQALAAMTTTGLSANQYMETFTSFSGTLLRGLNNDYAAAARIGDMAVKDMADNAATTGVSMETLRNTYQSLARGNFEMLDSLNLGFAGTQQGMADLINQSGVMGEGFVATAENVKSIPFDKYIEGIHKVQEQQKITGRAAEEALKTISGSLGVVTASWSNLLAAFGTGNTDMITQSFDSLVKGATALVTNVAAIIPKIIEGINQVVQALPAAIGQILPIIIPAFTQIITAITNIIPQIIPVFVQLILQILDVIITALPQIINAGVQIIVALITGIANALPQIIPKIIDGLESILDTIIQNLPAIIEGGVTILVSLIKGISDALPRLIPKIMEGIQTIVDTLTKPSTLDLIISSGIKLLVAIIKGLADALPRLIPAAMQVITALINALTTPEMINLMIWAAIEIIKAVVKGLTQNKDQMNNAADQLVNALKDGINNIVDRIVQAGKDLVVGLWNGIVNKKDWIVNQIKGFGSSVTSAIKGIFGIHSPSTVFRDQIGKNLALGIGEGFTSEMDNVKSDMSKSLPVSDFDMNMIGGSYSSETNTQPAVIKVYVGEEQIASKMVDLINDRSRLQGANAIFV